MKLTITTTTEDEVDEVLDLEIPDNYRGEVMALPGLQTIHGTQEITLEMAVQVAELFYLDLGNMTGVRCWLKT